MNISLYGSHNGGIAFKHNDKYRVIEIERFANKKNLGLVQYRLCNNSRFILDEMLRYMRIEFGTPEQFDTCIYSNTDVIYGENKFEFERYINAKDYKFCLHHRAHAAGTFYQSPFDRALIFSFDGGGSDGFFNVYTANREDSVTEINRINLDLGFAYMIFGHFLKEISFEPDLNVGNLVYSGKLMGLCGYGEIVNEWIPFFREFYLKKPSGLNYHELLNELGNNIGVTFDTNNRIDGKTGLDIAATSQYMFEEIFFENILPFVEEFNDLPICITGGCGLNVVCNTRVRKRFNRDVFVAPNSNDCGLALGMLLDHERPLVQVDVTYGGLPISDPYNLYELIENKWTEAYNTERAAQLIKDGAIVGVIQGNSEHGPRALGNRSILCNPSLVNMKDVLNERVKKREWFRPFAPVVRLEDVERYFYFTGESRFMSFYAKVREEWADKLVSITHIDGTARLQTVTSEQNPFLYNLLTEFEKQTGLGVLLNTSFNVNGKPLINSYKDALYMLNHSGLNNVFTESYIIFSY